MLDNMKLNHKIYGGFGIIIAILITIAGMSVYSNTGNQSDFSDYRSIARLTNEAGRVQANMLEARLAYLKYQDNHSADNLASFEKRIATTKESAANLSSMARTDAENPRPQGSRQPLQTMKMASRPSLRHRRNATNSSVKASTGLDPEFKNPPHNCSLISTAVAIMSQRTKPPCSKSRPS